MRFGKPLILFVILLIEIAIIAIITIGIIHIHNSHKLPSEGSAGGAIELTSSEVKSHNTAASCYMATNGVVYDVTVYVQNKQIDPGRICGQLEPDLTGMNIKVSDIGSYKIGLLSP